MSPNYGGKTDELEWKESYMIFEDEVISNYSPYPLNVGQAENDEDDEVIYRGGNYTSINFTPRSTDVDGLSTNTDALASTQGRGGKTQALSSNALINMGFELEKKRQTCKRSAS